jgi:hypothetical protein
MVFFGNVNQVLVRLWARNQVSVLGGQLSEVSDEGLRGMGGWSFVRLYV